MGLYFVRFKYVIKLKQSGYVNTYEKSAFLLLKFKDMIDSDYMDAFIKLADEKLKSIYSEVADIVQTKEILYVSKI